MYWSAGGKDTEIEDHHCGCVGSTFFMKYLGMALEGVSTMNLEEP